MLRVGLIGAGRIGQVHARNIAANPKSSLAAVSDVAHAPAVALARSYGAATLTTAEILADNAIDAVLIASSTDTHAELIEAASAAGKAVLCEKPIDLDLQRACRCRDLAAMTGQPVMLGFNRRFDRNFSELKASFDAGEIGKGELLSITSFDPAPPPAEYIKVSGGLFRDMAIHDFDMACWIFGAVPEKVTAAGSSIVDPAIGELGDIDTAVTILHFADGRIAVVKNSRRAVYGYDQRIELLGSDGLLSAGNILENTIAKASAAGIVSAKPEYFFLERYARAYEAEWSAFVDAVLGGAPVPVTVQDGVSALAVAEAATLSLKTGQSVAVPAEALGVAA
jgi:myo-inositol 2-dehydrogenase/D-chiro-inositol 1-dehydrogenase